MAINNFANQVSRKIRSGETLCRISLPMDEENNIRLFHSDKTCRAFFSDDWKKYYDIKRSESVSTWVICQDDDRYYRIINNHSGCFLSRVEDYVMVTRSYDLLDNLNNNSNRWYINIINYDNYYIDCYLEAPNIIGNKTSLFLQSGKDMRQPGSEKLAKLGKDPIIVRINILP